MQLKLIQSEQAFLKSMKSTSVFLPFCFFLFLTGMNVLAYGPANFFPSAPSLWLVDAGDDVQICQGDTVQLSATGANSYEWMPAAGLSCTNCPDPLAFPDSTTMYYVMGNDGSTDSVLVTVFSPPQILSVIPTSPSDCNVFNGAIVIVTATTPHALEYSINGGNGWQSNGVFTALSPGNYSIVVRNASGVCVVDGGNLTLTAPNSPEILNVVGVDPTLCDTPNGSIVISTAGGITPLQYSIDGGMTWQGQNTFQLLGSGDYDIVVRNADGSCEVSGGTLSLTASPDEPDITGVFAAAPGTCGGNDGLITVSVSNDPGNFQYSIDGGSTWQTGNSYTGLEEGVYHILVRRGDGTCMTDGGFEELISSDRPVVIGTSVVDPQGCGVANGNITVLAFGASTLEFSADGGNTWQISNIFSGLSGGNYDVFVRNTGGSCLTPVDMVTLQSSAAPVISGVSFNDPGGCGQNNGSINISADGNAALEYSIDDGATWSASPAFSGLGAGDYHVAIRFADGTCEVFYQLNPVLLEDQGTPPVINNVVVTQPSGCSSSDGAIAIQAAGSGALEYSINNGATFQAGSSFTGLGAGNYVIVVKETATSCSATSNAILTASSCIDTVQVTIPAGTTTQYCLDPSVFNIPGNLSGAGFCDQGNAATVAATGINLACVDLVPASGFTGTSPDLICTIHCFNNNASLCDTTYIQVTVQAQTNCDDIFLQDTIETPFLGNPTPVCIPLSPTMANAYDLLFNGTPLTFLQGCDYDSVVVYTYAFLIGGGFNGPYTLDGWSVNASNFTGFFNNVNELVDLMNTFDPTGNWQINALASIIYGGNLMNQYGDIELTHVPTGSQSIQMTNFSIVPNGFVVNLTNPNLNVLIATDPATGCSDTLYINPFDNPVFPDTLYFTTTVNTQTSTVCLDGLELPGGNIVNVGYCDLPGNGIVPLMNDTCFYYLPNLNYVGQDTFCMLVCGDGFPQVCDTTVVYVTVLPEIDTVFLTIPTGVASIDTCFNNFIIELPGTVTSAQFCGINQAEIEGQVNDTCLVFTPVNNFAGTTEACVVHCSGAVCDTTIVIITVEPPVICDEVFTQNALSILTPDGTGGLCIPIPPGEIVGYEVSIDGVVFSQSFTPCDFQEQVSYNYAGLPAGPYFLESWTVNGTTFFGNVQDLASLVDSMNVWDPNGNWTNDLPTTSLNGGVSGSDYSDLVISQVGVGTETLQALLIQVAKGSALTLTGFGAHEVLVVASNGCADTITVTLNPYQITTDTIYLETTLNTSISPICIGTEELLGNFTSMNFCSLAANGTLGMVNDTCVSYLPGLNFTGDDSFCLVVCDDNQPQVCDTLVVFVTVTIPVDTIYIDATTVEPFDTCLLGDVLQLPGAIDTAVVCGANPAEVSATFNGNCVIIDLEDDFLGTTTLCVVHCTADNPPVCDTTIIIVNFDGVVVPCPEIFNPDEVFISLENNQGEVCLSVPVTEISNYEVTLDGNMYGGNLAACDFDSVYNYFYGLVFGQGQTGPYVVTWSANGNTFNATVINIAELVNFMNDWDPAGDWIQQPGSFTIVSSNENGVYGDLTITHAGTGIISVLGADFNGIPAGTLITITGSGSHEVVLTENATGCSDTLTVNAVTLANVIDIVTVEDVPSEVICIDTGGLPGNFTELAVCQAPANGLLIINGNCFTYNPLSAFVGNDQGCVVVCDDLGNCDTTLLNITVTPLCSLYDFFPDGVQDLQVTDCADIAAYCTPVLLDSISQFGVLDNGLVYSGGFVPCNTDFTQISLDTGYHEVVFVHLNTGCQDTLFTNVSCTSDSTGCGVIAL